MRLEDLKIGALRSEKKFSRRCGRRDFVVEDWGWNGFLVVFRVVEVFFFYFFYLLLWQPISI